MAEGNYRNRWPLPGQGAGVLRLGERFRLDGLVAEAAFTRVWQATDELLCRPVRIHLLPPGRPVPGGVAATVSAAARVTDPRLSRIFDADYRTDCPYIVSEWAPGTDLEDLMATGLPSPALAAAIVADAAEALARAHRAGVAHLRLGPRSLRWGGSGVKVSGLGIEAALSGACATDPAAADTAGLARMLYALLTGCWPGPEATRLPPAPLNRGRPCPPRRLRPGVPDALNDITCAALTSGGTPGWLAEGLLRSRPPARPRRQELLAA